MRIKRWYSAFLFTDCSDLRRESLRGKFLAICISLLFQLPESLILAEYTNPILPEGAEQMAKHLLGELSYRTAISKSS
jgi:hypothetical protein